MNVTPDLTCSKAGITSITYSISAYSSNAIPSWVSLNSGTGLLSITAPNVTADTTYPFYVVSTYSGATSPEQKLIQITVLNWIASNCQTCSSSSGSVCSVCTSWYTLKSGICSLVSNPSPEAEAAKTCTQIFIGLLSLIIWLSSLLNVSNVWSLWSMINQVQLFFTLKYLYYITN